MFRVKSVKIEGFWGHNQIETNLHKDVNIFIGENGTGKTTFIKLLQAALSVDLELLYELQFDKIVIVLLSNSRTRKIEIVKKEQDLKYTDLQYQIGQKKYKLPVLPDRELRYIGSKRYSGRIHPRFYDEIESIKREMEKLIDVSYLSVNRITIPKEDIREYRRENIYDLIEFRLKELIGLLTTYQLQLETELSKHSKSFQEEVLRSMLFNEKFDYISYDNEITIDLKKTKAELMQAYRGLGILDDTTQILIDAHIKAIEDAHKNLNNYISQDIEQLSVNDVIPLTLLRRTQKINELSNKLEKKKKNILTPLLRYIDLLNEFHENKKFSLKDNKEGGISISKDSSEIPISQLSSGEKQLIILLTEALLQRNQQTLFIADEPELSLHMEWQRKILPSIRELNQNSQIIVATHSPEIVGKFKNSVINMENILK